MTAAIETRGLQKRYGNVHALQNVDITVGRGEVFGFLGANGAGKTTFTKCVTGFVRPDAGSIQVLGVDARANQVRVNQRIGLVPDQYDFYSNLTGRQHLDFYGRLYGMDARTRKDRIAEVLALVRMEERADTRVKTYSHGMKQRTCIAQAILHDPDLIFFDEPTNGLDPKGAYELREIIKGLARGGTTIFLNSHLLHEVEQVCKRVAILQRGRVIALSDVEELRTRFGGGGSVSLRVLNPSQALLEVAAANLEAPPTTDGQWLIFSADDEGTAQVVGKLVAKGALIAEVRRDAASLESVFLQLTDEPGGGR